MTPREKLQLSYEIAFFPPRLNKLWGEWKKTHTKPDVDTGEALDIALMLHLKLPESGYNSIRSLTRVAVYQAESRAFGMPAFIRAVRNHFERPEINITEIPGKYIRDFALPVFGRVCIEHRIMKVQSPVTSHQSPVTSHQSLNPKDLIK